ncbi:MAG: sodium-dependent transporter [Bacteroidales bacterium]|nr:sodium-dependent transporter [Bacteroidales bacterium]
MAQFDLSNRGTFGSKFGIIAAAAGSAIGLGNIWRFPYITGQNGGAAFLIVYLFFVFAIGIPVMLSEFVIGRATQRNPFGAFRKLAPGKPWWLVGVLGIGAAFMILAFYGAVGGWTIEYLIQSIGNTFKGKDAAELQIMFNSFLSDPVRPVIWQLLFMAITALIVLSGVEKGIERFAKVLMPVLLVIIIILDIRSVTLPGAREGLEFLFKPDFSKINASVIFEALGQAFFSLSIGMGTLITYGSYIHKKDNLANTAVIVSLADTFIAILAGIAIFPAVFAFNIAPAVEEGLVFVTLPTIFQQLPGGYFFMLLFFVLLIIAALTSSISVLEVVVAFSVEELKIPRKKATLLATAAISVLGVMCALSWGGLSEFKILGTHFFGLLNSTSTKIFLPLGGLLIVLFVGWGYGKSKVKNELSNQGDLRSRLFKLFMFLVRFIAPIAIALVFLNGLGILKF